MTTPRTARPGHRADVTVARSSQHRNSLISAPRLHVLAYWLLVTVTLFHALSAIGGGIGMVVADGLSMPKSLLADTPFTTFTIPGLILLLVVGGTQAWAAVLLITRRESALLWSTVAGFGMVIWVISEIYLIHPFTWIQAIYVVTGLLQLVMVLRCSALPPGCPGSSR